MSRDDTTRGVRSSDMRPGDGIAHSVRRSDIYVETPDTSIDRMTGDKDVCTWIEEWRSQIPYPREVTAINSNHLKVVIDAIKTLESKRS